MQAYDAMQDLTDNHRKTEGNGAHVLTHYKYDF